MFLLIRMICIFENLGNFHDDNLDRGPITFAAYSRVFATVCGFARALNFVSLDFSPSPNGVSILFEKELKQ
jgi:hypothetical protein